MVHGMFSLWQLGIAPSPWMWALAIGLLVLAGASGGLRALTAPARLNAALGSILALVLLWTLQARVNGPVAVQMAGVGLAVLMFGLRGALLLLAFATALNGFITASGIGLMPLTASFDPGHGATQFMLGCALPAMVLRCITAAVQRWLPNHLFVYLLGHGFFATGLATAAGLTVTAFWLNAAQLVPSHPLFNDILPVVLLLASGEAFLIGMLSAIFVMYRPQWMLSFEDWRYLPRPTPGSPVKPDDLHA
jgi:uncharacterized membrane protein